MLTHFPLWLLSPTLGLCPLSLSQATGAVLCIPQGQLCTVHAEAVMTFQCSMANPACPKLCFNLILLCVLLYSNHEKKKELVWFCVLCLCTENNPQGKACPVLLTQLWPLPSGPFPSMCVSRKLKFIAGSQTEKGVYRRGERTRCRMLGRESRKWGHTMEPNKFITKTTSGKPFRKHFCIDVLLAYSLC